MKQIYKLLILFVFVYVTFAFGKELYTQDQDASAILTEDTTVLTEVPLIEGAAAVATERDSTERSLERTQQRRDRSSSNEDEEDELSGRSTSGGTDLPTVGNFLMGTDDAQAVFWGLYDSQSQTLQGETRWYGNPALVRVGVGSYTVTGPDAGTLQVNFTDPTNPADPGLTWTGTYGNGQWTISNSQTGTLVTLTGRVFQAPQ